MNVLFDSFACGQSSSILFWYVPSGDVVRTLLSWGTWIGFEDAHTTNIHRIRLQIGHCSQIYIELHAVAPIVVFKGLILKGIVHFTVAARVPDCSYKYEAGRGRVMKNLRVPMHSRLIRRCRPPCRHCFSPSFWGPFCVYVGLEERVVDEIQG